MQTLTEKEIETICTIANKGPLTGYDLHLGGLRNRGDRTAIMSSAHWLKLKKSLGPSGKNMIKLLPKIANKKYSRKKFEDIRGRRKDVYDLTLLGWIVFSGRDIVGPQHVLRLINSFKDDAPLVFGMWDYFKKESVKEIVEKQLINSLKICFSKYLALLANLNSKFERIKRQEPNFSEKQFRDEFMSDVFLERKWIKHLTNIFLFNGFRYNFEKELDIDPLSVEELINLKKVFNKNKKLCFYRTLICRQDNRSILFGTSFFSDLGSLAPGFSSEFGEKFFNQKFVENRLSMMLLWKIKDKSDYKNCYPLVDIVNLVYDKQYFFATLKICQMYVHYPFLKWEEFFQAIPNCMYQLAKLIIFKEYRQEKVTDGYTPTNPIIDLESAMIEILAALNFFNINLVQVWGTKFYEITPDLEKLKIFKMKKKGDSFFLPFRIENKQVTSKVLMMLKDELDLLNPGGTTSILDLSKLYIRKRFAKF